MHFSAYNFNFKSNIDLTDLSIFDTLLPKHDSQNAEAIEIIFKKEDKGKYKQYIEQQTENSDDYAFYNDENYAFFEILNGKQIIINYFNKIDSELIQSMLNYPVACLAAQKKYLCLHSSAIELNGKVYLFPGKTHDGKSSIAASLISKGAKLITEDICIIDFKNNYPFIRPSYHGLKISNEIIDRFNCFQNKQIIFTERKNKRSLIKIDDNDMIKQQRAVDFLIFPEWNEKLKGHNFRSLKISEGFIKILGANLFLPKDQKQKEFLFRANMNLANRVKSFIYERNKNLDLLKNLNLIEEFNGKVP